MKQMKLNSFFQISALSILLLATQSFYAQTEKKTYYDVYQSKVKEVYSTNSIGEKQGSYKSYFENGVLAEEANYNKGRLEGLYKEYVTIEGRATLYRTANFKNGELNGPSTTYFRGKPNMILKQGSYLNGKEQGEWIFVEEIAGSYNFPEGFKHYKTIVIYDNGQLTKTEPIIRYYPSNKVYAESNLENNKIKETKIYFPSGKLAKHSLYDKDGYLTSEDEFFEDGKKVAEVKVVTEENNLITIKKEWYSNGSLKYHKKIFDGNEIFYEGYNEDGSEDKTMLMHKENEQRKNKELENQIKTCDKKIKEADSLFGLNYLKESKEKYSELASTVKNYYDINQKRKYLENNGYLDDIYKRCKKAISIIDEKEKIKNTIIEQENEVTLKYNNFLSLYTSQKSSSIPGSEISFKKEVYPKGKSLYEKSNEYYLKLTSQYKQTVDENLKIELNKEIIKLLDKLIEIEKTDTKAIDKELKKSSTTEETKQILGL